MQSPMLPIQMLTHTVLCGLAVGCYCFQCWLFQVRKRARRSGKRSNRGDSVPSGLRVFAYVFDSLH